MRLQVLGHDHYPMGPSTYMWVDVIRFGLPAALSDRAAIAALVTSPGFAHDFASPYEPVPPAGFPPVHARWRLDAVTPDLFRPVTPATAEEALRRWATEQEWTEPGYVPPADALDRLDRVIGLLGLGALHELRHPADECIHEYGRVTGEMGFHEFLVMDRAHETLHQVVASDD